MSELSDIKARAAERRDRAKPLGMERTLASIEDDLDRAIASAEKLGEACDAYHDEAMVITKERDQARAAALALREHADWLFRQLDQWGDTHNFNTAPEWKAHQQVLADTEWLEQHRD